MRKNIVRYLVASIVVVLGLSLLLGNATYAATCGGIETTLIECEEGGDGGIYHILALIINILSMGVGILGVIGLSWAGVQYLSAGGSEEKVVKSKRRIYEIVIGLICFVVLWAGSQWLLPGGLFNISSDDTGVTDISISYSGNTAAGKTFAPTVKFNEGAVDKTYSLVSDNKDVAVTKGNSVKCVEEGSADITAIAANGIKATMDLACSASDDTSSSTSGSGSSSGNNNPGSSKKASDGSDTVGSMMETKLNGKPNLRKETRDIIKDRRKDFYYNTYKKVVKSSKYGSYKKYVKSLGGVFEQYADKKKIKVKTAADLQAAVEYVWGLWSIWGVDYGNGSTHHSWNGDDAFYYGLPGRTSNTSYVDASINDMLSSSNNVRTCCNMAINTFVKSTSLKGIGGAGLHTDKHLSLSRKHYKKNNGKITKWSELEVGDVIHFFVGGGWRHVALVGEVYSDYVVIYDGGSKFTSHRNYKFAVKRKNSKSLNGTPYSGYSSWWGFRPWSIDQSVTLKGIN